VLLSLDTLDEIFVENDWAPNVHNTALSGRLDALRPAVDSPAPSTIARVVEKIVCRDGDVTLDLYVLRAGGA